MKKYIIQLTVPYRPLPIAYRKGLHWTSDINEATTYDAKDLTVALDAVKKRMVSFGLDYEVDIKALRSYH